MPLGIAKIGLINGITGEQYEGTDVSADLLWHMRMIPVSSFSTTYDVTTANGYESNGINVGGTTLLQMSLSMMAIKLLELGILLHLERNLQS